jgi:SpoVK/Ycf46/Vps4 family AAA+-type ATPase
LSALFHGPPGTGKTLAACVLANELGVEVYRVDLAQVVSKWVGETEKNLARIFEAASRSKALILFDEADSLFGKRTEVRTAVDRYSNLEVNYLLQKLEDFDGVAVLTTNFPENIDPAFKRRIRFKVAFPFPDASLRATMWQTLIPSRVPRSGNFDFSYLGHAFEFSGAQIKNAILRACFRAASEDRGVTQTDLVEAAKVEAKEAGILVRCERG